MTKTSRKIGSSKPTGDAPSFEQAIQRLETLVTEMESAELPLDELLKRYEEGTRLVRFCSAKLTEAEKKIELLTKKADGSVELAPFEPDESAPAEEQEGKLF